MFKEVSRAIGDSSAAESNLAELEWTLRGRVGADRYSLWLGPPARLELRDGVLVVLCPSTAHRQWIERNLRRELLQCSAEVLGDGTSLLLEVVSCVDQKGRSGTSGGVASDDQTLGTMGSPQVDATHVDAKSRIDATVKNPPLPSARNRQIDSATNAPPRAESRTALDNWQQQHWQFSTFESGEANRMALEVAREAARSLGRYSPLVFYGPTGCGKTHILHAIGHALRRGPTPWRVWQATSEQFTSQFLEALQQRKSPSFRHKCRSIDALLVDDVEFLAGKTATLAEFVSTLDALQQRGGQIVLTCADGPQQLQQVSAELASRAAAGLAVAISHPEFSARLAIVRQTALRCRMTLGEDVAELVAQRVVGSGRLLAGALNRMAAVSIAERRPMDRGLAEDAIDAFCREHAPQVRLADIQRAVCHVFGVEPQSLKSSRRDPAAAHPRMLAMWLARKYTRAALSEIGDFFGRRSHSTVVSAQRKIDRLVSDNSEIRVADHSCRVEDAVRRLEAALRVG